MIAVFENGDGSYIKYECYLHFYYYGNIIIKTYYLVVIES